MAKVGESLARALATLEDGLIRSDVQFRMKSRDLRRYVERMGGQLENMQNTFQKMGELIQERFFFHFQTKQGPDEAGRSLQPWPDYNEPLNPDHKSYFERKVEDGYPEELGVRTGDLERELQDPSNINAGRQNLSVQVDVGHAIFMETGFTGKGPNKHPSQAQTRRPSAQLTDQEEEDIIQEAVGNFFDEVDR